MDLDPGILCFNHCSHRLFCFAMPECCPSCQLPLGSNVLPFRVPYPFVRASQHNCSVVVKSTDGNFLKDYEVNDDLHIGITSSRSVLFEFDSRGLTCGVAPRSWDQSLVVYRELRPEFFSVWDNNLQNVADNSVWTQAMYNEKDFNCYDFVLAFFKTLEDKQPCGSSLNKTNLIEKNISPVILQALKYIKLYRVVRDNGLYVMDVEPNSDAYCPIIF